MPSCAPRFRSPWGVVAWVDHDHSDNILCLNADHFTAQEEEAITALLAEGRYTTRQVLDAFVSHAEGG